MSRETQGLLYPSNYCKRSDLSSLTRLKIASLALLFNDYGKITNLSRRYNISRTFIYNLKAKLLDYCQVSSPIKTDPIGKILSLRMEGNCSVGDISRLMKRESLPGSSVGYISEKLSETGTLLGNQLIGLRSGGIQVSFCSDEIFTGGKPILITVEPQSLAILGIELSETRKSEDWQSHWQGLSNQEMTPLLIAKDEGTAMKNAQATFYPDVNVQSDTFHAISHRLGAYCDRLEKQAYASITTEYEKEALWTNAKSEGSRKKWKQAYLEATNEAKLAINLYDNFVFIYRELLACLCLFDKEGCLRNKQVVMANFDAALELGALLENEALDKHFKAISALKDTLFTFYDAADKIISQLKKDYEPDVLGQFCLAWQKRKNRIKTKDSKRKTRYKNQEEGLLEELEVFLADKFSESKEYIYEALSHIIQSSAVVECINSILRPYLNTCKNQPTQQMLNLFMFYHNHRRFVRGERKGYTPFELLTEEKQPKDWLELALDKVKA